ncbi:MAG: exodeoxyribonuclease VII small subunit [Ruminococcaceae bacterium]|nr:exodeoxyribonuclease VII small subunit [Oscillospiraceae bacterium]
MAKQEFSFEKALEELQSIVSALENGNAGLDESLGLYERGVELVRLCNRRLEEAGQRVQTIRMTDGAPSTIPFSGENDI